MIVAFVIVMIGILIIAAILYMVSLTNVPQADVRPNYSQLDVFRDMEPNSQIRENPWVGFIQEDVRKTPGGPLGDFKGNDASAVVTYPF